jgi:D-cysteine desulfhydrase family pyridoxal phosphate-dependent enzyme
VKHVSQVSQVPRLRLANLPTPLHEAPRLRIALGGPTKCPRILFKRDDLTGLATGGNKARKLEYSVAHARREGATVLVATGSLQSNHARSTAAAARLAGMRCVLVLNTHTPKIAPAGNHLLDLMLGAEIHFVPPAPPDGTPGTDNPHEIKQLGRVTHDLKKAGEVPHLIPLGASDEIGTVGYVEAAHELEDQLWKLRMRPTRVYVAAGTRGTQAGLTLGAKISRAKWKVHGIAVSPGDPQKTERAVAFTNACAERLGRPTRVTVDDFITHQDYFGAGYAIPTAACQEAIQLAAHTEAVILDPVYTGKAMAGLIDHIRRGDIQPSETVVFVHTGGTASVFAQADQLAL